MEYDLVVKGKIVNHDSILDGYIGISDKRIKKVTPHKLDGYRKINAADSLIFPGFIDIHTHLREDGRHEWDYKEDFTTGTRAAIHGGVTTVVDMPNTKEPATNLPRIKDKKKLAKEKGKIDVLFYGGVTKENIRYLPEMAKEVVGYKIFTCESTGGMYLPYNLIPAAAEKIKQTGKPISFHCEDQSTNEKMKNDLLSKTRGLTDFSSPEIHLELRPPESEVRAVLRVLSYDIYKPNFCHVSTINSLQHIMNQNDPKITCEVTLHHLFFNNNHVRLWGNLLKTNPPIRSENDRHALKEAYKKGNIDFLVTDHAPHTVKEKKESVWEAPSGIAGLDNFGNVVSWMLANWEVNPKTIARTCSYNQSKFLGLKDRGAILAGNIANLTILNLHKPEKVTSESLYTKCGISPYVGIEFPGRVEYTIVNGEIVMEHGKVLV